LAVFFAWSALLAAIGRARVRQRLLRGGGV